jgi:hypothetical protein
MTTLFYFCRLITIHQKPKITTAWFIPGGNKEDRIGFLTLSPGMLLTLIALNGA